MRRRFRPVLEGLEMRLPLSDAQSPDLPDEIQPPTDPLDALVGDVSRMLIPISPNVSLDQFEASVVYSSPPLFPETTLPGDGAVLSPSLLSGSGP
jgi:hypothetical protein